METLPRFVFIYAYRTLANCILLGDLPMWVGDTLCVRVCIVSVAMVTRAFTLIWLDNSFSIYSLSLTFG